MAENTVEVTLKLSVDDFQRAIKAGAGTFRGEMQGLERSAATGAQRIGDAMRRIGVRPFGEIDREIRRLQSDYQVLARSGQLSAQALTQAHIRMQEGVRQLAAEKNGWVQVMGQAKGGLLALAASGAGLIGMMTGAARASSEFQTRMAEINTLLDVTPERFAQLTQEVRALAVEMGVRAPDAARALYDILSAGVPEGNAVEVLRQSVRAAVAGVTDTQSAARVGLAVINAYGKQITDLGSVYDVLFQTVKSGVTTLPQLSASLGQVLPIAAASKVPIEEVAAAIASMTQAGIDTAVATTSLRAAITALSTPVPEAQAKMDELGISWKGLFGTLEQIARLNLDPAKLREIVPDVTARTGVLALTRDIGALSESIDAMVNSAGATDEAYAKMADTPEQRMREFKAALAELALQLGDMVTAGAPVVETLTGLVRAVNGLPGPVKSAAVAIGALIIAKTAWALGLRQVWAALRLATAGLTGFVAAVPKALAVLRLAGAAAGPIVALITALAAAVVGGIKLLRLHQDIEARNQQFVQQQQAIIDKTREYADTQILAADQVAQLTAAELANYQQRLQAARDYHRAQRDLISREDMRRDGPTAAVSPEALEAARRARVLDEELTKIKAQHQQRETAETNHRNVIEQIKKEETDAIKVQLGEQLKAYDDATKKLEKAQKERLAVEEFFRDARARLSKPQAEEAPRSFMDMASLMSGARTALAGGDFEKAIDLSQEAARALEELREAGEFKGELGKLQSLGFLSQLEQIATEAARSQEDAAKTNVDKATQAITELVSKAEFLKMIEIGFDGDTAEANAEALRKRLQDKLANNPIIMPVQLQDTKVDPRIDQLLDNAPRRASGGLLSGPGTETSDSILLWGSKNEYMLRAAAVRHYGLPFIEAINRMRLPKFANGGLIGNLAIPGPLPAPAMGASGAPVHLHLDGREFPLSGAPDTVDEIQRVFAREALKRGRRVR